MNPGPACATHCIFTFILDVALCLYFFFLKYSDHRSARRSIQKKLQINLTTKQTTFCHNLRWNFFKDMNCDFNICKACHLGHFCKINGLKVNLANNCYRFPVRIRLRSVILQASFRAARHRRSACQRPRWKARHRERRRLRWRRRHLSAATRPLRKPVSVVQ